MIDGRNGVDLTYDAVLREIPVLCPSETWTHALFQVSGYIGMVCGKRVHLRVGSVVVYVKDRMCAHPYFTDL